MDNLLHPITARVAAFGCFLLVSACDGPERFTWENHPTLSWDDFRGTSEKFEPGVAAATHSGLTVASICKGGTLDVWVTAYFSPTRSWVRPNRKDLLLLEHEQGHFDITELYARKLRQAILYASIRCEPRAQADAAATRIMDQLKMDTIAAHEQYDTDTKGATDPMALAAASNSIANELASLDSFKFHQADCSETFFRDVFESARRAACKEQIRDCYNYCTKTSDMNQRASCYRGCAYSASNCRQCLQSLEKAVLEK